LESVFKLESKERYGYLIRRVADFEEIFLITDKKGNYISCGNDKEKIIPIWPELEFAQELIKTEWKKCIVKKVELDEFMNWLDKLETENFKERIGRLLIPLFFGTLFIVPPQTYFQYINEYSSYWQLYKIRRFETNHLWFIENLYVISVLIIALIIFLKSQKSHGFITWFERTSSHKMGLLLGGLPLRIVKVVLKRYYPTSSSSLANFSETFFYTYFFIIGILFASSQLFWENLKNTDAFILLLF
jgi:hypothetical protein